jgi:hypothetical protein
MNLGFRMDDASTDANEGELRGNTSWLGMDVERHRTKSSAEEADDDDDALAGR